MPDVDGVQSVRRGDSYGDFGSQGDTLGMGRVYLGLLDNQAKKLALVADTVWRIVVLWLLFLLILVIFSSGNGIFFAWDINNTGRQ